MKCSAHSDGTSGRELDLGDEEYSASLQDSDDEVFKSMLVNEDHLSNTHEKELKNVEILDVDADFPEHDNQTFLGACFDSVA